MQNKQLPKHRWFFDFYISSCVLLLKNNIYIPFLSLFAILYFFQTTFKKN